MLQARCQRTRCDPDDINTLIAPAYWSVAPDPDPPEKRVQHLLLQGAIVLRVTGGSVMLIAVSPRDDDSVAPRPTPRSRPATAPRRSETDGRPVTGPVD